MSGPAIRAPNAADFSAIAAIYAAEVARRTTSFEIEPPSASELEARYRSLSSAGYPYFVAVVAGRVVGYCYAGPYRERPAYRFTVENSIYVDDRYRARGVGRALLQGLIRACEERGFRQMIAVIAGAANEASVRLHAGAGFRTVGNLRRVGWKLGAWQDTLIMQRGLGADDAAPAMEP